MTSIVPAGWYPDPNGLVGLRYWDGDNWTQAVAPTPESQNSEFPIVEPPIPTVEVVAEKKDSKMHLWITGIIVVLVVIVMFISTHTSANASVTISYKITVARGCYQTDSGYNDIAFGSQVEVFDGKDALLGFGNLGSGESDGSGCTYSAQFTIPHSSDKIYRVTSGNANRGFLNFTDENLVDLQEGRTLLISATLG